MDIREVRQRLARVLKDFTLDNGKAEVTEEATGILRLLIVSSRFKGLRNTERFQALNDSIASGAPDIFEEFAFVFEALTPAESARASNRYES